MRYSISEYIYTRIVSIKQQNEAKYPINEYNDTRNTSTAGKPIRNQAEQIREDPAEYVARKYGIRGDADGQKDS